jgi:hypothetical protein
LKFEPNTGAHTEYICQGCLIGSLDDYDLLITNFELQARVATFRHVYSVGLIPQIVVSSTSYGRCVTVYQSQYSYYFVIDCCAQDEEFIAFRDINPSAQHHIQLIPKTHIGELDKNIRFAGLIVNPPSESVKELSKKDVDMREHFRTYCTCLASHLYPSTEDGRNRTIHS